MAYLEGKLRRRTENSEHTGYVLEVEVEMTEVDDADDLFGEQVALTGDVRMLDFPERGKILVFKATSAAAIETEDDEEYEEDEEDPE
ncbi:hypothetical protein [Rubrobacter indicoceani]|uniref:hypothetical protein n=1 Tax=Rubrobacter indicoceani TaxID=2051957 RepID=UPI000E5B273C|nr:hypothetical protein [Rubrobacter indicoceani]